MSFELPTPQDEQDQKLLDDVRQHGWHVVKVPEDEATPGWCFTVGLQRSFGHPELLVFGLALDTGHAVLNIAGESARTGRVYEAGLPYDDFLEGFDCIFHPVQPRWYEPFLGYACWFYRDTGFRVLQMFWPDRHGFLPWHGEAEEWMRTNQPRLFEVEEDQAGVRGLLASMEKS